MAIFFCFMPQKNEFVPETPQYLRPMIEEASNRSGLPTKLISAQLSNESIGFNEDVVYGRGQYAQGNVVGAAGVGQFMPATAIEYGLIKVSPQQLKEFNRLKAMDWWTGNNYANNLVRTGNVIADDRTDPKKSIEATVRYMVDLVKSHGTVERALSVYNSGNPNNYKNPNFRTSYGSVGETYKYVRNITSRSGFKGKLTLNPQAPQAPQMAQADTYEPRQSLMPTPRPVPTPTMGPADQARPDRFSMSRFASPVMAAEHSGIPTPSAMQTPTTSYSVRPGDTLFGISQQLLGSGNRWRELQGYMGDPRKLPVGTQISAPGGGGGGDGGQPAPQPRPVSAPSAPINYTPVPQQQYRPQPRPVPTPAQPRSYYQQPQRKVPTPSAVVGGGYSGGGGGGW